ncbi:MAG: hypothetical protein ABI983_08680, partial [Acidobacteriota bacterium]
MNWLRFSAVIAVLTCGAAAASAQAPPLLPRLFLDDHLQERNVFAAAIRAGRTIAPGARIAIPAAGDLAAIGSYLDAAGAASVPLWLAIDAPQQLSIDEWRSRLRAIIARSPSLVILEIVFTTTDAERARFVVEAASTDARAAREDVLITAGGTDAAGCDALLAQIGPNLAVYLDAIVVDDAWMGTVAPALASVRDAVPGLRVLGRATAEDPARIAAKTLSMLGTEMLSRSWRATPADMAAATVALLPAADLLLHPVELIEPASVALRVSAEPAGSQLPSYRLLFDAESFATYFTFDDGTRAATLTVEMRLATPSTPAAYDLSSGRPVPVQSSRDEAAARTLVTLKISGHPTLIDFSAGIEGLVVERARVTAARTLSVAEVIARHRRQQARQDALLKTYRASARMEQHFRPSLTDAGYDVVTENDFFVDGKAVEWEELSFSVNGSKWGADRPAFPLLQAEKVLSLPLDLRLDESYRYELDGFGSIDGVECYRVRFEPTTSSAALYKGTAWIDRASFATLRVQAVQTRLSPPIASNEEQLDYRPVGASGGVALYALTAQSARQIVLIAGRNLLLEKSARFENFQLNDDRFAEWRDAARRGNRIMYRETDQGLRYLVKQGVDRVVSNNATTSAKAMAMGVLVDPSYSFPIPIFGINYLAFELRGRQDTQFALLFGGVFAAGNVQRSRIGRTHLDASLDFFGIAVPSSDRLYLDDGEREAER